MHKLDDPTAPKHLVLFSSRLHSSFLYSKGSSVAQNSFFQFSHYKKCLHCYYRETTSNFISLDSNWGVFFYWLNNEGKMRSRPRAATRRRVPRSLSLSILAPRHRTHGSFRRTIVFNFSGARFRCGKPALSHPSGTTCPSDNIAMNRLMLALLRGRPR